MTPFCVYEHWRPDKQQCFYVGKGTPKRAHFLQRKENPRHLRIVEKLRRLGLRVEVKLIAVGLSEDAAFSLEIERIGFWRGAGVDLANLTNGGEGASGQIQSQETRAKISAALLGVARPSRRGVKLSDDHRAKISAGGIGRTLSIETRAKISASQKGKPRPELVGRKMSEAGIERLRNRIFTEEHRHKISEAKKGKPKSAEHRAKIGAALTGRKLSASQYQTLTLAADARRGVPRSEETKAKISAATKGRPGVKGRIPWCKGKHLSEETKKKMSAARLGKRRGPMSVVQKEKIRYSLLGRPNLALKGKPLSEAHRQKLVDAWERRKLKRAAGHDDKTRSRAAQEVSQSTGST